MQFMRAVVVWVGALTGVLAGVSAAQAAAIPAAQLDPVVVTGTRTERLSRESPVRTEVISSEEMATTHARDLKEALQYLPGIQLREIRGKSGYEVWIQGLNADRVLILVDGMPVSPTTGSSVDVTQLSLLDVERVEVVKGATSALYGSAAMGGVVNIITRNIAVGTGAELELDGGTYGEQNPDGEDRFGTQHGRVSVRHGGEHWRGRLALDENANGGIDPDPASWPQPGDEFKRQSGDGRLEWYGQDERVGAYVQAGRFNENTESRSMADLNADNISDNLSKNGDLERTRLGAGGHWQTESDWLFKLDAMQENLVEDTVKHVSGIDFDFRHADYGVGRQALQITSPQWEQHQLVLGLDVTEETLEQSIQKDLYSTTECELQSAGTSAAVGCGDVDRQSVELYAQDDWFIRDNWELLLGARYQEDSDFGSHFSPKLNLRHQVVENADANVFLLLGWGAGFRVPNLKERYYVFDHTSVGYVLIGNPDLQPESSSSWQAGIGTQWQQNLTLDFNLFYNDLDDLIAYELDGFEGSVAQYRYLNLGKAKTWGAEITTGWRPVQSVQLNAGYTWLKSENEATGDELARRPRHQISAGLDWTLGQSGWQTGLRWRAQSDELLGSDSESAPGTAMDSEMRSPGWGVLDLKVNFDWSEELRLFGGIDNLFNRQRDFTQSGLDFAPLAGRYPYVGVRLRWGD